MFYLPVLAALGASVGWAGGIVLAQWPARKLGAFEFTRIQLVACSALMMVICTGLGRWVGVDWVYWPALLGSTCIGILLGNLAMMECLRRGGPRRTEVLLSLKAPLVAVMAYFWLKETPTGLDLLGACITLMGVGIAVLFGKGAPTDSDAISGRLIIIVFLGLAAAACQGFGFLVMKPAMLAGVDPIAVSAIRLTGAALLISVIALWPIRAFRPQADMTPYLLFRTILPGFIGYGISSTLLLYAFANFEAAVAAVLGSLSQILVLPIIWIKDGARPTFMSFLGAALAVVGTAIIMIL